MRVLFCKISYMKFYKGVIPGKDDAYNGGSYVEEYGEGHEQYNFDAVRLEDGEEYCLGFVETKSRNGKVNTLHIEKILGCEGLRKENFAEDVLVIWCATSQTNCTSIIGWYKHATVYRNYQICEFDNGYIQNYYVIAKKDNCILLPHTLRNNHIWDAAVSKKRTYGFGRSMLWYAREPQAQNYVRTIVDQINKYNGKNDINERV